MPNLAALFDTQDPAEWQTLAAEFMLDGITLQAEDDNGLVGFLTVTSDGSFLICVRPDARRKGIGTQLLQAAGPLDFSKQHYTAEGRACVQRYLGTRAG
jgi:GNAT superfamily N-acetyltransferase